MNNRKKTSMKKIGRKAMLCLLVAAVFLMSLSAMENNITNVDKNLRRCCYGK
jgi:hypothetical protein